MAVGLIATSAAYTDGKLPSNNTADFAKNKGDASLGAKDSEDTELGAKDDSDALGATVTGTVYIRGPFANNWADPGVAMSQKNGNYFYSVSNLERDAQFKFKNNDTEYGKNNSDSSGGKRDITGYGTSSSGYNTVEEGTSTFFWKGSTGAATIWVSGDLTKTWVTSGTTADTSYAISYNDPSNGSFTTKPTSANSGSTVTVVATPNTGYQLSTFTVTNSSTSATISTSGSGNTKTFTMPSANVSISATFSQVNYTITKSASNCTITAPATATYGSTVNFTVAPDTNCAIKSVTVKQGTSNVSTTKTGEGAYSFTMPAGNVTITATCTTTVGLVSFKFKSATAWVYHPFISINGGPEVEMTLGASPDYLDQGTTTKKVKPYSQTGSLRYAWFTADLTGIDTSKPVTITVRGQDTYMEATGTFTLEAGSEVWLACDNLMEGSTLVNVTGLTPEQRDFYDTPLNMIDN
jgi:hypothetical protein